MYGRMASTLVMCVVQTILPSYCLYLYCVDFGDVRGLNPSMVRLSLSSIKYVHARQRDEARQRAETDRSVKERIANLNDPLQSHLFARHLYSHAWFNTSLAILGSTHRCYVNGCYVNGS